jgi:hypothetical protein
LLPDLEELIGIPSHHAAGKTTPTPLDHAAKDLDATTVLASCGAVASSWGIEVTHHWLRQPEFMLHLDGRLRSAMLACGVEVVANEGSSRAGIGGGSKGEE